LRDAIYDANTSIVNAFGGSRISLYEFRGRIYLVQWRYSLTWLSGEMVRAYSWCSIHLSKGERKRTLTFDFGQPALQRIVIAGIPIVASGLLSFILFLLGFILQRWPEFILKHGWIFNVAIEPLTHAGILFPAIIIVAALTVFVLPWAFQAQLYQDRQALLEWAIAVLDLSGPRPKASAKIKESANTQNVESASTRPELDDFHSDVGAAMAKDYQNPLWRYIGYFAIVSIGLWILSVALEPAMPLLVRCVPTQWEEGWGRSMVSSSSDDIHDPIIDSTLQKIGDRLLEAAPGQPYHFEFRMRRSRTINAFAAPGGQIVILSGLISATRGPNELAGVMAHEIQHVLNRHSLQELGRERILNIASRAAYQVSKIPTGGISQNLLALKFSHREESEADRKGIEMLATAGIDPTGLLHFFEHLREPSAVFGDFLSNHPLTDERMSDIKLLLMTVHMNMDAKPLDVDWDAFAKRAQEETQKAPKAEN